MSNRYQPFSAEDFKEHKGKVPLLPTIAAEIANEKFSIVIQDWVPIHLMREIERQKNEFELEVRLLRREVTKLRALVEGKLGGP